MAFMRPYINTNPETYIVTYEHQFPIQLHQVPDGDYYRDDLDGDETLEEDAKAVLKDFFDEHPHLREITVITGLTGYLHAPGCLDQTDVCFGDTVQEVAQQLLDLYFDRDPEYMDDEEKDDMEWLKGLAENCME